MGHPPGDELCGEGGLLEDLAQDRQAARELSAHDAMGPMGDAERPALVAQVGAEEGRGVLIFEALGALSIGAGEEEAYHRVVEAAVDEAVDDRAERRLAAYLLEITHMCIMRPPPRRR